MNDWQLLPRNERTTELYFTDYHDLATPTQQTPRQVAAFTVHNIEHHTVTYHYVLTAQPEDTNIEQQVADGVFTLAHDQFAKIQKPFTVSPLGIRVFVKVNLSYSGMDAGAHVTSSQKQSIHYWLTTSAPATHKVKL